MGLSRRDRLAYWLERKIGPGHRLAPLLYADGGVTYRGDRVLVNRVNGHHLVPTARKGH